MDKFTEFLLINTANADSRKAKDYLTKAISLRMELSDDPFYDYCDEILASIEYLQDISKQNIRASK